MIRLKKKKEEEAKAKAAEAEAQAAAETKEGTSEKTGDAEMPDSKAEGKEGETAKVSIWGGGLGRGKKGKKSKQRKTPGELRMQKGGYFKNRIFNLTPDI